MAHFIQISYYIAYDRLYLREYKEYNIFFAPALVVSFGVAPCAKVDVCGRFSATTQFCGAY